MSETHVKDGYVTDIDYTWGAYNAQNPKEIDAVAAINGCVPVPLDAPFTYCDLGCGNGLTLNLLAAAYPQASFHGIDLNPRHIENARGFADRAGLGNVRYHCLPFAEAARTDLPEFDFMALHGVYTWVPQAVRQAILALLRARLKPSGFAYIAYNAMPGWAALEPLRRLMVTYAEVVDGSSLEKARAGLAYLRLLQESKAAYFEQTPAAGQMLDALDDQHLTYVAHEYLNEAWEPIYFTRMVEDAATAGLRYVGSMPLWSNLQDLIIPPRLLPLFKTAPDRTVFEAHKDFVTNQRFRMDVFTKQPVPSAGLVRRDGLTGLRVTAVKQREQLVPRIATPHFEVTLSHPVYEPLMRLLTERAWSGSELAGHPELTAHGEAEIMEAIFFLLVSQQFEVALGDLAPMPASFPPRVRFGDPVSALSIAELAPRQTFAHVVSPATGGILRIPLVEGLFAQSHVEGVADGERPGWLLARLDGMDRRLMGPDGPLEGEHALAMAAQAAHAYAINVFPHLWRLGILAPL